MLYSSPGFFRWIYLHLNPPHPVPLKMSTSRNAVFYCCYNISSNKHLLDELMIVSLFIFFLIPPQDKVHSAFTPNTLNSYTFLSGLTSPLPTCPSLLTSPSHFPHIHVIPLRISPFLALSWFLIQVCAFLPASSLSSGAISCSSLDLRTWPSVWHTGECLLDSIKSVSYSFCPCCPSLDH